MTIHHNTIATRSIYLSGASWGGKRPQVFRSYLLWKSQGRHSQAKLVDKLNNLNGKYRRRRQRSQYLTYPAKSANVESARRTRQWLNQADRSGNCYLRVLAELFNRSRSTWIWIIKRNKHIRYPPSWPDPSWAFRLFAKARINSPATMIN